MNRLDYWRMYRARGARLPIRVFRDVHAFDLKRGTDTAARLLAPEYGTLHDVEFGEYWPSWTSQIDYWYRWSKVQRGSAFATTLFVDLGCGKGKALIAWLERAAAHGLTHRGLGVEVHAPLAAIARANVALMGFEDRAEVLCEDASQLDLEIIERGSIVYLYHPFGGEVLRRTFERLAGLNLLVIYANPVHGDVLESLGYTCVHESSGWHANQWARAYAEATAPHWNGSAA